MKFEIKNRWTGSVIFECEALTIRAAVELAVEKRVSLSAANLSAADLSYANLRYADLRAADLSAADLRAADLSYANLRYADLRVADLRDANLRDANLRDANLSDANLRDADLSAADLRAAKEDFLAKLSKAKNEAVGLYKAVVDGKIDGSCYEGECSCFCGTIATVKGINYREMEKEMGIVPNGSAPVERWFAAIRKGDTPENNPVSAITAEWMKEFFKTNEITPPTRQVTWV